ncbi:hypothetical protein H8S90_18320 [Olivibacter sp. SDN3]|uniref:DUF7009 family protein n=1 Tax=Olivibacter sp. SDN3 TaxID=2764720 RepID=UPI0016516024|nr:hypothetical protein [Olivibacter sp. SDN3]QNL48723.1 hypothetical protein H8S90_18320 [Olivibacter sp. SDN3]
MKIRIKGNSVRYRLTKSDVEKLGATGFLEERSEFAGKTLVYAINSTKDDTLSADYVLDRIELRMPKVMIDELNNTDSVGFEDRTGPVSLLVEKDFTCLDNVEEDQSDNFPNPLIRQ